MRQKRSSGSVVVVMWGSVRTGVLMVMVLLLLAVYLLDEDVDTLASHVHAPRDVFPVDVDLGADELTFPRTAMQHQDVAVLMEDFALLRHSNQLVLPSCPPGVKVNADDAALGKLRLCSLTDWARAPLPPELAVWGYTPRYMCEGKIAQLHREVALLRDVIMDKAFCEGRACREDPAPRLPPGRSEELTLHEGFFLVPCLGPLKPGALRFRGAEQNHANAWTGGLMSYEYPQELLVEAEAPGLTIAVRRYEYWNVYHSMADIYNAYMATRYYNVSSMEVTVLFLDGAAPGPCLPLWKTGFRAALHISEAPTQTLYRQLFWNKLGYGSEFLDHSSPSLPLAEDFRRFILQTNGLNNDEHKVTCDSVNVLLVSRQNYDNRTITRRLSNEEELVGHIRQRVPHVNVTRVRLELLPIRKQLRLVAGADVLLGMHGAGMTLAMFLPPRAAVIELLPHRKYWSLSDGHFRGISAWRGLVYVRWQDEEEGDEEEPREETRVPPVVVEKLLNDVISKMCSA